MNNYNTLFEQIPVYYDLFALVTFASILIGLLIFITILFNNKPENQAIYFLGIGILILCLVEVDFFLCHTGLLKYVPWLYNSTEVGVLLLLPCFYFFVKNLLTQTKIQVQKDGLHLLIPLLYLFAQVGIHLQSNAFKLNHYIFGFHPNLSSIPIEVPTSTWYQLGSLVTSQFHELLILYFLIYIFLSSKVIRQYNVSIQKHFPKNKSTKRRGKYRFSIYAIVALIIMAIVTTTVFASFTSDLGEKYIMVFLTGMIFILAYVMMSASHFFDNSWLLEKYHTSGLNLSPADILQKITTYVEAQQYYLKKDSSLKDLATQLSISPTYLSQIINKQTGQNFNDFINQYRIEEAKKRLIDDAYAHLNIAGIGETVGFKSKSAFYTAFKKNSPFTPAAYAKAIKKQKTI